MSQNQQAVADEDDLKRKLVRRVAFAGLLIAMLLAALAFVDYLGQPGEEPASSGPTFSAPVPVAKKEVTQPVKPAEPDAAPVARETVPAAEATAAPPSPAATADLPVRPDVAAQPALPRSETRSVAPPARAARPVEPATPAEGSAAASSSLSPPPERAAAPPPAATAAPLPPAPPAPPRLFSGYAVQAGVFADVQHAEELRAKLTLNGIPSTLEARVQVGPFKTREEAEAARQKLKALGIDGILLPPKGARR
ncbi:SPOR domain-containing protein [Azospira restricta]|uniref:SPOR domain-containing protein n=1 Tax=Azospira restricta TaxID=404405 RepID=A0A974Y503_9RHOO|nr:SPOR domain-containing protein [Azospira restricta]QRJ64940.1 SPOR domain-containing protein [Azospira restricta]